MEGPQADSPRKALQSALQSGKKTRLIDVRPRTEFGICHLPGFLSEHSAPNVNKLISSLDQMSQ